MARKSKRAAAVATTRPEPAGDSTPPAAAEGRLRPGAGVGAWLDRPAGVWFAVALGAAILAIPWWLMIDELYYYVLFGDDFSYISGSLDWATLRANLWKPHNTHVVPLFRLWTFAVVAAAGRLEDMQEAFGAASYLGLVVAMLVVGCLAAKEGGRTAVGLAAMAFLGFSTLVGSAVQWYSAGQALWAGTAIVVTVLLAREWSRKGGVWLLVSVCLASVAATAVWSGGLIAGPAAMAYLAARDPSRFRRPVLILGAVTAGTALSVMAASRGQIRQTKIVWERHPGLWPRPIQSVFHSAQAIAEEVVLGNLGLDAVTTHWQAVVLVLILAGLWAWSRGGLRRINPLEAAGATIVVGSYLLVYAFRGNLPYSSLRPVTWYHAIPQVGAALFAAGWWTGLRPLEPAGTGGLTRRQALGVLAVMGCLCVLRIPRAERALIASAPKMTASEALRFPVPELQRLRALYHQGEDRDRQLRVLARLDKAGPIAARLGAGREDLRRVFGPIKPPGQPENQVDSDAFSLLRLPDVAPGPSPDPARLHAALDELLRPEPHARPAWLAPGEPWPPR